MVFAIKDPVDGWHISHRLIELWIQSAIKRAKSLIRKCRGRLYDERHIGLVEEKNNLSLFFTSPDHLPFSTCIISFRSIYKYFFVLNILI